MQVPCKIYCNRDSILTPINPLPHPLFCFVDCLFFFWLKNISVENNMSSVYLELNLLDQPSPPPPSQYQKVFLILFAICF